LVVKIAAARFAQVSLDPATELTAVVTGVWLLLALLALIDLSFVLPWFILAAFCLCIGCVVVSDMTSSSSAAARFFASKLLAPKKSVQPAAGSLKTAAAAAATATNGGGGATSAAMKRSAAVATPKLPAAAATAATGKAGARAPKSGGACGGAAGPAVVPATAPSSLTSNASSSETLVNAAASSERAVNGSMSSTDETLAASPSPDQQQEEEEEDDWRAPQRLLEGVVTFPSLFWWDEAAAGRMTLAALMKIGLVYSLAWTVKRVHTALSSTLFIRFYYGILLNLFIGLFSNSFALVKATYDTFNSAVARFPIKVVSRLVTLVEYNTWWSYHYVDCYLAFRIKDWIRNHPRTQETASQLMDDFLHWIQSWTCRHVHPNSDVSTSDRSSKSDQIP